MDSKYDLFVNEREKVGIETKAFTDYSQIVGNVYENLEENNPAKKTRVLISFDDLIAYMETNKKL